MDIKINIETFKKEIEKAFERGEKTGENKYFNKVDFGYDNKYKVEYAWSYAKDIKDKYLQKNAMTRKQLNEKYALWFLADSEEGKMLAKVKSENKLEKDLIRKHFKIEVDVNEIHYPLLKWEEGYGSVVAIVTGEDDKHNV